MKVLVVGLGLIGGSMAKAIKKRCGDTVVGLDQSGAVVRKALLAGSIDEGATSVSQDTDMVLLALYPGAAVEFVRQHRQQIPPGCLVVDLCGVKRRVSADIEALLEGTGAIYIGGHPMAGKEFFGFDASDADLFEGASMILTPSERVPRNQCLLAELFFQRLGFGAVTFATVEQHDEMIALTSQLAHIVSSAYVQSPDAARHTGFSAGSFRDMTRVAKLHEGMWTELFLQNADYLSWQLGHFIDKLGEFKTAIDSGDSAALLAMLKEGRVIKEQLNQSEASRRTA